MIWFCCALMAVVFTALMCYLWDSDVFKISGQRFVDGRNTLSWKVSSACYFLIGLALTFLCALPAILYKPNPRRR